MQTNSLSHENKRPQKAATEFTLTVHGLQGTTDLEVVRGRGGDYFLVTPDSRVVAALVVLDRQQGLAWGHRG
jgi:hypothetical protein